MRVWGGGTRADLVERGVGRVVGVSAETTDDGGGVVT